MSDRIWWAVLLASPATQQLLSPASLWASLSQNPLRGRSAKPNPEPVCQWTGCILITKHAAEYVTLFSHLYLWPRVTVLCLWHCTYVHICTCSMIILYLWLNKNSDNSCHQVCRQINVMLNKLNLFSINCKHNSLLPQNNSF